MPWFKGQRCNYISNSVISIKNLTFINIESKSGAKIDPCCTPFLTVNNAEEYYYIKIL